MDKFNVFQQAMARRRFLTGTAQGFGYAALGSLLGGDTVLRAAAPSQGERSEQGQGGLPALPHFAPKAKRVIYFHMVGGPSQMDMYRLQAGDEGLVRQGLAREHPRGPAADDDDQRPDAVPDRAVEVQVRTARRVRDVGQRVAALHRQERSTTCASSARCTPRRSITSRRSRFMQTGNQITGRPCIGSWLSYGLGSMNENLPTFVVLVAEAVQHRAGPGDLGAAVGIGLFARATRRCLVPQQRRPDPVHQQPAGRVERNPSPNARRAQQPQRA